MASASKAVGANIPRVNSHNLFLAANGSEKLGGHIVAHPTAGIRRIRPFSLSSVQDPSHPSYELVYGMLYGIRNAVVETSAKRANRYSKYRTWRF